MRTNTVIASNIGDLVSQSRINRVAGEWSAILESIEKDVPYVEHNGFNRKQANESILDKARKGEILIMPYEDYQKTVSGTKFLQTAKQEVPYLNRISYNNTVVTVFGDCFKELTRVALEGNLFERCTAIQTEGVGAIPKHITAESFFQIPTHNGTSQLSIVLRNDNCHRELLDQFFQEQGMPNVPQIISATNGTTEVWAHFDWQGMRGTMNYLRHSKPDTSFVLTGNIPEDRRVIGYHVVE